MVHRCEQSETGRSQFAVSLDQQIVCLQIGADRLHVVVRLRNFVDSYVILVAHLLDQLGIFHFHDAIRVRRYVGAYEEVAIQS